MSAPIMEIPNMFMFNISEIIREKTIYISTRYKSNKYHYKFKTFVIEHFRKISILEHVLLKLPVHNFLEKKLTWNG